MVGRRNRERRETLAYWPTREAKTGKAVGLVSNISEEGIQIHSQDRFSKRKKLTLNIAVTSGLTGTQNIPLVVENVWCRASGIPGLYHAGFKIIEITDQAKRQLRALVDSFSYPVPGERP